ncbi:hypothetical protein Acsp04_23960 [Actinomadura sp. NBRC 104425]|nr:hypothetical protein Acsp04_23960 [Actinomadura sp. NBRC 104425]
MYATRHMDRYGAASSPVAADGDEAASLRKEQGVAVRSRPPERDYFGGVTVTVTDPPPEPIMPFSSFLALTTLSMLIV